MQDEGRKRERIEDTRVKKRVKDTYFKPSNACFNIHLTTSSDIPPGHPYLITSAALPAFINLSAICILCPSIQLPRTRRTFGCFERDIICVSRWRRRSEFGGSVSRSRTLRAQGTGPGLGEDGEGGGWWIAEKTVEEAPKPMAGPSV